jgi:hypothetical protein
VFVILMLKPGTLTGDPVQGPLLALTHLTTLGWIGSLLFAAAYLVGPFLAQTPLWSRRLPALHLACHLPGLALLVAGLLRQQYFLAGAGAILISLGIALLILNLVSTASIRNVWDPANLSFQSSLFWLAISGGVGLVMIHGRLNGHGPFDSITLIALHAHLALFGFLTQALLGASLRIVPQLLASTQTKNRPERLPWFGWAALNLGLLLLLPATFAGSRPVLMGVASVVTLGILCYVLRILSILLSNRKFVTWGTATYATGLLLLAVLVFALLWRLPGVISGALPESGQWIRLYISLALAGPFSFAILGTGELMIPRLVWALRYQPWKNLGKLPTAESLSRTAAAGPAFFCLLMAWVYLAFGQWTASVSSIQLGAVLMLAGVAWFVLTIAPSISRLFLGVTPADVGLETSSPTHTDTTK